MGDSLSHLDDLLRTLDKNFEGSCQHGARQTNWRNTFPSEMLRY